MIFFCEKKRVELLYTEKEIIGSGCVWLNQRQRHSSPWKKFLDSCNAPHPRSGRLPASIWTIQIMIAKTNLNRILRNGDDCRRWAGNSYSAKELYVEGWTAWDLQRELVRSSAPCLRDSHKSGKRNMIEGCDETLGIGRSGKTAADERPRGDHW